MSIVLKNLYLAYERELFSGMSLTVEQGARVCLLGGSGSGKTTLLNIILGLTAPDSGSVYTGDAAMSCVFQQDRLLLRLTAAENVRVMLPSRPELKSVEKALLEVGIPSAELEKPVSEYSGGMARRVAVVRAVMASSQVLIMDEPFKGLDETLKLKTMKYVIDNLRGRSLVFATHEPQEAEFFSAQILTLPARGAYSFRREEQ